ncbi:MAG TPA: lysylphosphatidylglycerol synthase transmembrane domain-containing protein [Candidatus Ozemobacteraceae bacterium]
MKKWAKKIIGLLLSVLFLWLALRQVDWERVPAVLSAVDWRLLPVLLVSYTLEHLFRAVRWRYILHPREVPLWRLYAGLLLGYLFNNLFPARAGEFIRSWYLKSRGHAGFSEAFGSVVMERLLDGICVVGFIAFAVTMFPVGQVIRSGGYTAVTFYGAVLLVILLLQFRRGWVDTVSDLLLWPFPDAWKRWVYGLRDSFIGGLGLVRHPWPLAVSVGLSLVSWGASLVTYYITIKMFTLPMGMSETLLLIAVLSLGAMIPSSPGMIGIYEYCCILVLTDLLGLTREVAVAYGLATHFLSYFYVLAVGIVVLTIENLHLADLETAAEQPVIETPAA